MANERINRRRNPIFSIDGIVRKSGEGWFLIEQNVKESVQQVVFRNPDGSTSVNEVNYLPYTVLVTFAKNLNFHTKVVPDAEMRFAVEVGIGWDARFKKCIPRFWLVDCQPLKDYMDNVVAIATGKASSPDIFDQMERILNEPEQTPPPAPAPAPQPTVPPMPQTEDTVPVRARSTRASKYAR